MSLESMIGSFIGTVVNIILDPIFIFALGLGAAGAAIATVIGYIVTCGFFIICISKKSKVLSMDIKLLVLDGATFGSVFAIGLPSSITNLMQTIGITLTNRFLQPYGDDNIAIMGIVLKIVNIALLGMPLMGICLIFIVSFQSTGKATGAFILSACRQGIVFLPVIVVLSFAMGLNGVIMTQFVSDVVTTVVAFGLFKAFLWKDI